MLFVNPTALDWAERRVRAWEQKGVSAGQPEIGRHWRRCWEFGHLCSQPGAAGPRRPSQGRPCLRGSFASCSHLGFPGHPGACRPLESRSFVPVRTEGHGNSVQAQHLLATSLAPHGWCCLSGKAPCLLPLHPWD